MTSAPIPQNTAVLENGTDINLENGLEGEVVDPIYNIKAAVLNGAIQEIGMGRYQWGLAIVTGFGWLADNLWPVATGLILPPVIQEFDFEGPFLKLGQNIGLLAGAAFWGIGSDVWGRRISFNITFFIIGIFATVAGASPSPTTLISLVSVWSIGVGGNIPVDSAIFLEFIPASHQYLLTVLSIWWAFGQLLGSLVAWPLIGKYSCKITNPPSCTRASNQGWRYFLFTMGGLMLVPWAIRFFAFNLYESPKYLMGKGKDEQAVETVHKVAEYNRKESSLSIEDLRRVEKENNVKTSGNKVDHASAANVLHRYLSKFDQNHVKPLFATRKIAFSTSLLIILWALIGLAFPLYNAFVTYYLATRGADFGDGSIYITYRNQVILSVIGVPGAIIAGYLVDLPLLGRRGTLAIFTLLTGIFILASTTARTSDALLGWNCAYSFTSNVMYGVLYTITPELFPTKDRGTGNALTATANRIFGIMAPIIALYADLKTSVPIFISGAIFIVVGFIALLLPFESRGKAAL
ncbi:MFS general substrate transporter [Macrolepiota fuliginosa MF-IS2]|uniref:MFS general substrate transporter n=1 Tax=Macrolepiota fuliginosa MF-IS2 TaxID=1400762 RepID=A0A9P5X868_9AGAR|nr:MFS general substrate transporter [Macrolepiota fuliginosa MF-IS2]